MKMIVTFVVDGRNLVMMLVTLIDMYYVYWSCNSNRRINL